MRYPASEKLEIISEFETWLSGTPAEAFALARSFDSAKMRIVQSGFEKKDLLAA